MLGERFISSITEAFHTTDLPEKPTGKLTKAEKADYERRLKEAKRKAEVISQKRRKLLSYGLSATAVGLGAAVFGPSIYRSSIKPSTIRTEQPEEFTGEVNQTTDLIHTWKNEVDGDPNMFLAYNLRISHLSIAYLSKQMREMFPDKSNQYNLTTLKNRLHLVNVVEMAKQDPCGEELNDTVAAIAIPNRDGIYIVPERFITSIDELKTAVHTFFAANLHEQLHLTPPLRKDITNSYIAQRTASLRKVRIDYIKGMKLFHQDKETLVRGPECYRSWWEEEEETIVHHSTLKLSERVKISDISTHYDVWVNDYESKIVRPFFGENYRVLLEFHQSSNPDGFYEAIGSNLLGNKSSRNQRIDAAINLLVPLLDRRRL